MSLAAIFRPCLLPLIAAVLVLGQGGAARAGEVKVAVASNFTQAAIDIGSLFTAKTGHQILFSFGSTGQLFTQIAKGAPYEVFLAADMARPEKAVVDGLAVAGSLFTYATGRIVLYSRDTKLIAGPSTLKIKPFARIALANPATAPYGVAAIDVLKKLGVYETLAARIVRGNNIAQTHQFVQSGNAELGFVALSQIIGHDHGSRWQVPENLHPGVSQGAVLLRGGTANAAARAFMTFLAGPEANQVKQTYGYGPGTRPKLPPDA